MTEIYGLKPNVSFKRFCW